MKQPQKPCRSCQGDGVIEVCPVGHTAACPCAGRNICCPDCDGLGTEDDDEATDPAGVVPASDGRGR